MFSTRSVYVRVFVRGANEEGCGGGSNGVLRGGVMESLPGSFVGEYWRVHARVLWGVMRISRESSVEE